MQVNPLWAATVRVAPAGSTLKLNLRQALLTLAGVPGYEPPEEAPQPPEGQFCDWEPSHHPF